MMKQIVKTNSVPDIASLRLVSQAARYHWIEQLERSIAFSEEETRILKQEPRHCLPSRTNGQFLDSSALLIIAILRCLTVVVKGKNKEVS